MKIKAFRLLAVLCSIVSPYVLSAQGWGQIEGEGPVVEKTFTLEDFHSMGLGVSADVYIRKGNSNEVRIKGQANIIDNIKKEVNDGSWSIEFDRKANNYRSLEIYVSMSTIRSLAIGGSGNIIVRDAFSGLGKLEMAIGGSGNIEMAGSTSELNVSIAGSGNVRCEKMRAENCEVSIAGSGDCLVEVGEQLNVSIAGSGDVKYRGNPKLRTSIAGSGKVRSVN